MKTFEEMQQELKRLRQKQQDEFIDKLEQQIDWMIEKANDSSYQATDHERVVFNRIRQKLENMNKWF